MTDPQPALGASEDTQWASFAHFGGLIGFLPALIIFVVFHARGEKTNRESREALNWQITFSIGFVVLQVLATLLVYTFALYGVSLILPVLVFALWVANAIFSIMGGLKVQGGGEYRYPFALRLIK